MRIDADQIYKNRRVMDDSTLESPFNAEIEDGDADYGEYLFDNLPGDRVGFMPPTEKEQNGKRKRKE